MRGLWRSAGSWRGLGTALVLCCAGLLLASAAPAGANRHHRRANHLVTPGSSEYGCSIFPADNPLNQEVANLPESPNSQAYVESIGLSAHLHPDFGNNPSYGIPFVVVGPEQPKVPIKFTAYRSESDPGPYPVPLNAPIEGGGRRGRGDKHVLVLQEGTCIDYELYKATQKGVGWRAASGAVFNLHSNALRPEGWTSADAAGLPILPLLVRYPEVAAGAIDHALRVTVPVSQRLSTRRVLGPGADHHGNAQALRPDRRRQWLALVHHRGALSGLERSEPRTAQAGARVVLRSRRNRPDHPLGTAGMDRPRAVWRLPLLVGAEGVRLLGGRWRLCGRGNRRRLWLLRLLLRRRGQRGLFGLSADGVLELPHA